MKITVVGGGLAGSECALQLAEFGHQVQLYEMRSTQMTPAHKTADLAELVCSNSFGSLAELSAPGQLKWEAEQLGSHVLKFAKHAAVPAGQALGIDREEFAKKITLAIEQHPRIELKRQKITSLAELPRPCVIATGPLTEEALANELRNHFGGEFLYFFDAIAPVIDADSINYEIAWKADRYDKGTADYLNCPLNKEEYFRLVEEISAARKIEPKDFEKTGFFEGCMPIETMVERGLQTLRFGPMKPVGLRNPRTEKEAYAVVQLRQENKDATAYNMVGFQTRMAYGEQKRVFRMIPGLEQAEFLKLGSIHRNLFINSPAQLTSVLASRKDPSLYFAGQITGVEGYFESACIGLLVARFLHGEAAPERETALGSLLHAITDPDRARHFQPTNINFGLLPPLPENTDRKILRDKSLKKAAQIQRARAAFERYAVPFSV